MYCSAVRDCIQILNAATELKSLPTSAVLNRWNILDTLLSCNLSFAMRFRMPRISTMLRPCRMRPFVKLICRYKLRKPTSTVSRRFYVTCASTGLFVLYYFVYVNWTGDGFKTVEPWPPRTNEHVNWIDVRAMRGRKVGEPSSLSTDEVNRRKLLYSKIVNKEWIKYFPQLADMLSKAISAPGMNRTIPENVEIRLDKSPHVLRMGETLGATIIAKDENSTQQSHGGDFFWAILRPANRSIDGVYCAVADNSDGTYDIKCILPFAGAAELRVTMLHPSESVLEMMTKYSSSQEYGVTMKTEMKNSANRFEHTDCSIDFPDQRYLYPGCYPNLIISFIAYVVHAPATNVSTPVMSSE